MTDNFLSKAKADGQVFIKTVNLVTQLSKLKLAIHSKKQERDRLLREIGVSIFENYRDTRKLESDVITNLVLTDLENIRHLEEEIADLAKQMEQVKAQFRTTQGVVDKSTDNPPKS